MRIVVYAEGGGEAPRVRVEPGELLPPQGLGPAHALVRRILGERASVPAAAVQFLSPLRVRGRWPAGSDLLLRRTLRRLLTWADPEHCPDHQIVLVDDDGTGSRASLLGGYVEGLPASIAIGVPVNEFESWLLADHATVQRVVGRTFDQPPDPSSLAPGVAKERLADACGDGDGASLRLEIARTCDLDLLCKQPSFERFAKDVARFATD